MEPDCLITTESLNDKGYGYGIVYVGKRSYVMRSSIAAYLNEKGPIPPGMLVRHTCDTPSCVNPEHLILGTHLDNARDRVERGRNGARPQPKKEHCLRGHPFDAANTRLRKNGVQICRTCHRERERIRRAQR